MNNANRIEPDVNILTLSRFLYLAAFLVILSCGSDPGENEIVIRASDLASADTSGALYPDTARVVQPDTVSAAVIPDTSSVPPCSVITVPDTLETADTSAVAPADTVCPWERYALEIKGSIYATLGEVVDEPDILGAHIVRCMWWNTDPWSGMNAGDSIYVLLGETGRENRVVALRYVPLSGTANHSFSVYTFTMSGDNYPSMYYADGLEMMKLLDRMPITTFEEMTGPYGEPRGNHTHAGVDFKAPEGTPVRTCRGGTVSRINWNHDYNGNCVEIDIGSGYGEIFLHLSSVEAGLQPGSFVERGSTVGYVGNTGRTSTAAHLHYQINDENGNPIDPYLFYSSHRRALPESDMGRFRSFRDSCDIWLRPE